VTNPMIPELSPDDFFGTGVQKINTALSQVLNVAETFRAADVDSGIGTPILTQQGSSVTRWKLPAGVVGVVNVLDHGVMLRQDQFAVDYTTGEVVLGYTPGLHYNISVVWSPSKGGFTTPVSLAQDGTNPRRWRLPQVAGVNVLILDHGRLLRRDEYQIQDGIATLSYNPAAPYDISAAWGAGGPGIRPFQIITLADPAVSNVFKLPEDFGRSITVTDYGFILSEDDYSVDRFNKTVTLNYVPAMPLNVAVSWGYPVSGVFSRDLRLSPDPDGVNKDFVLPFAPVVDTLLVTAYLSNGLVQYYNQYADYTVSGRVLKFSATTTPPVGSKLIVSMMSTLLSTGEGSVAETNQTVHFKYGVDLAQDTLVKNVLMTSEGAVTAIQYLDGATLVKSITFSYNTNGSLASVVETAGGKTFTQTFSYDAAGLWTGVVDTIS